jgi:hypothetical protein
LVWLHFWVEQPVSGDHKLSNFLAGKHLLRKASWIEQKFVFRLVQLFPLLRCVFNFVIYYSCVFNFRCLSLALVKVEKDLARLLTCYHSVQKFGPEAILLLEVCGPAVVWHSFNFESQVSQEELLNLSLFRETEQQHLV